MADKCEGFWMKLFEGLFHVDQNGMSELDLGILKVALLLAAIDGRFIEREIAMFDCLARKCKGWTEEASQAALKESLHSAGYLLIQSKRLEEKDLLEAFLSEAQAALPEKFNEVPVIYIRRAFVIWTLMGYSDIEYSVMEHKAILALREKFGLESSVSDSFLDTVRQEIIKLNDASTVDEAVRVLSAFVDFSL